MPSATSASAASVASSSGSDAAAANRPRSNSSPSTSTRSAREREPDVAPSAERRLFVLREVGVVRERQALDRGEQTGETADRRPCLAARQLGDVRVQLLRHHRRAGGRVLGQVSEPELARRPEAHLFGHAGEVDEERGTRVEVVECVVPVGHSVDRVPHRLRRRRQRQRRSGDGARPERGRLGLRAGEGEPRAVALEHLDPREQMVAERDRDRPLQMRVRRHRRRCLALSAREQAERELPDRRGSLVARVLDVEPMRRHNLVVSGAARMDLAPDRPEQPLDRAVHVFVARLESDGSMSASRAIASASSSSSSSPAACRRSACRRVPWMSCGRFHSNMS